MTKLSAKKKKILDHLQDSIPELRKGQISAKDGGDIKLGTILDAKAAAPAAVAPIAVPGTATAADVATKLNELIAALIA